VAVMEDNAGGAATLQRTVTFRSKMALIRRPSLAMLLSLLSVAAVLIAVASTFGAPKAARIQRGASWGVVVLFSMAGWGSLVERVAVRQLPIDFGLRLAWGAGALVGLGGLLCVLSLAKAPVLLTLVLGGALLTIVHAVRWGLGFPDRAAPLSWRWPPGAVLALAALSTLAVTYFLGGVSGATLNINDDHAAYLVFPKKLLATGTMIDPFSLRRVTALGGHSFLQALTLLGVSNPMQIAMFDLGLAMLMVIAIIVGSVEKGTRPALRSLWALPVALLVTLPNIRANSASEMSGVLFFLALFRTASCNPLRDRPRARAAILGLLAAATCTLRQSYVVPVAVFMVVLYLPNVLAALRASGPARREHLVAVGIAAGTLLLCLLPWAILSYRSNRTLLFPLMNGNYNTAYGGLTTESTAEDRVKFFWTNICHCNPIRSLPFFLFAGLFISGRKTAGALPALLWAAVIGFVAVVYALPLSDEWNIARYYYGFTVPMALAVMMAAFAALPRRRATPVRAQILVPVVFAGIAVVAHVQESRDAIYKDYLHQEDVISKAQAKESTLIPKDSSYKDLQAKVPAGAKMLVMLDEPFWLDFRRNRVDILDLPGAVSPRPGMPLTDDQSMVDYLAARGYRYVAFVRPAVSKSLYRRTHWARELANPDLPIWKISATFYLNTFDRFESLAKSRSNLYDDGQMVALDLATMK
jgi:hypothetical protein